MIESLCTWAERTPGAPALIERERTVSYGALLQAVRAGAAWLHQCGVRQGDTVAYSLNPPSGQTDRQLPLIYALFYLGAPLLPLYPGVPLALRGALAARFDARWLIAGDRLVAPAGCSRLDPAEFDPENGQWQAHPAPRGDDPARPLRYQFTSGTTGTPKVVLLTGAQSAAMVRGQFLGWTANDRVVPVALWPGKSGLCTLMRTHMAGGALVNLPFPETREQLASLIEEFGVTAVNAVPWQLRKLLSSAPLAGLPPLRYLGSGGAFISPEEIRAVRAAITSNLHVSYACSECATLAHLGPEDPFDAGPRLIAGVEGQAVDADDRPLRAEATGRLRFRTPWMPSGYVGNASATAERFRDGWFYPGDTGSIDAAGRVNLQGRADDTINSGGTKVRPHEVEKAFLQHPDIADAALVGIPDPTRGEIPVAFVVLRRSTSFRAVRDFCTASMDGSQLPHVMLTVDSIPRNPEGKVLRDRLLEIYRDWATRRPLAGSEDGQLAPTKADPA